MWPWRVWGDGAERGYAEGEGDDAHYFDEARVGEAASEGLDLIEPESGRMGGWLVGVGELGKGRGDERCWL